MYTCKKFASMHKQVKPILMYFYIEEYRSVEQKVIQCKAIQCMFQRHKRSLNIVYYTYLRCQIGVAFHWLSFETSNNPSRNADNNLHDHVASNPTVQKQPTSFLWSILHKNIVCTLDRFEKLSTLNNRRIVSCSTKT